MLKISVLTPTIRPEGLKMVARCLRRQDFIDWEWIIVIPKKMEIEVENALIGYPQPLVLIEPPKRPSDFYNLNKAWNLAYNKAEGELIVDIVDYIWFPPDTLTRLWNHYQANPKGLISGIGHQYEKNLDERPINQVWVDPRSLQSDKSFFEVSPNEVEMCLCSIPRQAILDCGGLDKEFDRFAALSEKEMCWRMSKLGYNFFIDKGIEYRALKHDRIGGREEWDKAYFKGCEYYQKCLKDLENGTRPLNVGFIDK